MSDTLELRIASLNVSSQPNMPVYFVLKGLIQSYRTHNSGHIYDTVVDGFPGATE